MPGSSAARRCAGGRAGQHALNLQQLARGVERFAVADAIRGMYPLQPGQRRDKIFADPFDQPGSRFAVASGIDLIGKDRTRRIGENKFRFRRVLSKPGLKPSVPPEPTPTTMASMSPSSC